MSNHDEVMNKVHRYARGLFGETDYHETISPHLENLQPQFHEMLTEQIGAQSTRRNQKGYDPKAAFVTALMNTMNYQLNPTGEDDRHQDEISQQFTQAYDQYGDTYDSENGYAEDAGHHGSEVNWDTHPGAVFAAKLGEEKATVLGYHMDGNKMQGAQAKYWHALENKLRSDNSLLYSIPQNVTHEQYEKAMAHGGGDNLIQAAYSALSSDDAMKSHGYSSEKDESIINQGKLSSSWLAKDILGDSASDAELQAFEERLLSGYGKAKRQSDVDFGMHGVQSGYKTDLLKEVLSPNQLPDFMIKPSELYTKEDWNKVRSYNFALNNINKMLFRGGDQDEVASRKSKFDAFKGNEFSEIKDELARISDNDAATYLTTSANPIEKEREQRYNELEAMGLEKTGENLDKLDKVYEGSADIEDLFSKAGTHYGRQRRTAKSPANVVTQTTNIIKDLRQKYAPVVAPSAPITPPAPIVAPPQFDDSAINEMVERFQQQQMAQMPINASGHVDLSQELIKDDDETANRILRSMGLDVSTHAQRSDEWHEEKRGRLSGTTAQALTKGSKAALNEAFENYIGIAKNPQTFHSSLFERGEKDEPVIQEHLEKLFKERGLNYGIGNSGFITNPNQQNYGYSPDGIIYNRDDDSLVGLAEYKSVDKVIHGGDAWNKKYMAQVQLGMHVTGAERTFHTQLGKAEWENGKLIRPSYTAEVARDPNFNPEEHEFSKRKELIDSYRGMREDKDLVNTITGMSNEQVRKMSNLTGIAEGSSDSGRIKEGLLAAFEQMAQDGGDKYPQLLSNRKAEEAKQERQAEKEEARARAEKEEADRERWDSAKRFAGNVYDGIDDRIKGVGNIFGGGMMDTVRGSVDFIDRFGGMVGSALKTASAFGESTFIIGDEIKERIGEGLDAGYINTYEHKSQATALQMLGMNEDQARKSVKSIANARNLATIGDTGQLASLVGSTRGLLHTEDIMRYGSDPEQLIKLLMKRGKDAGFGQEEMAGIATLSGLDGLARINALGSDENYAAAEDRIASSRARGAQGTDTLRQWVAPHARNKLENTETWEAAEQKISEQGQATFEGLAEAADKATKALLALAGFASGQDRVDTLSDAGGSILLKDGKGEENTVLGNMVKNDNYNPFAEENQVHANKRDKKKVDRNDIPDINPTLDPRKFDQLNVELGPNEGADDIAEYRQMLEGSYKVGQAKADVGDLNGKTERSLYGAIIKTVASSTKDKAAEVKVNVVVSSDDSAVIQVRKDNKLLTERKVHFTHSTN